MIAIHGLGLASLIALLASVAAHAELRPLDARVIWLSAGQVYIAAEDSIPLEPATPLVFVSRRDTVATGEVTAVLDRRVARARLLTGALKGGKHLERLRILAGPPPALGELRVGYPAPGRAVDPSRCTRRQVAIDPLTQRLDTLGRELRVTRLPGAPASSWPDTLIVREFDDVADQEIALERGELDVAVFWPGEPSARMRDNPRWPALADPDGVVVCDSALRPRVARIGPQAFIGLLRCLDGVPR